MRAETAGAIRAEPVRLELPSTIVLRIAQRALRDMQIPAPIADDPSECAAHHPLARKFYDDYHADPERVDRGVRLREIRDVPVFRLRSQTVYRGAVWYDREAGVIWLCRALSIADYHNEEALYAAFGDLHRRGQVLPPASERDRARSAHFAESVYRAFKDALGNAYDDPEGWYEASTSMPDGETVRVGRVYVQREIELDGELVTRFLLVVKRFPGQPEPPGNWIGAMLGRLLPSSEPVRPVYDQLPPGTDLQPNEIPFMQTVVEDSP